MDPMNPDQNPVPPPPTRQSSQQIDFQKAISTFTLPDWLIVGGALVAFIASFLPWYTVSYNFLGISGSSSVTGWDYWSGSLAAIVALATIGFFGGRTFNLFKM